jgi:predicted Zn-dependent protease with MMP-like domain
MLANRIMMWEIPVIIQGWGAPTAPVLVDPVGLRPRRAHCYKAGMDWSAAEAPTIEEFEGLALAALASLPETFRRLCEGIIMRIEEFPDEEVCAEMGLESPFDLTGLYQGIDLTQKSVGEIAPLPDMIFLYRRPILDEWSEGGVGLARLIRHVLVHEIGHHFGLSDEAMHEIEAAAEGVS